MSFFVKIFSCCQSSKDVSEPVQKEINNIGIAKVDTFSNIDAVPSQNGQQPNQGSQNDLQQKKVLLSQEPTKDETVNPDAVNLRLEETHSHSLDMTRSPDFTSKKTTQKASSIINEGDTSQEKTLSKQDSSSRSKQNISSSKSQNDISTASGGNENLAMIAGIKMNRIQRIEDENKPQEEYDFGNNSNSKGTPTRSELNDTPVMFAERRKQKAHTREEMNGTPIMTSQKNQRVIKQIEQNITPQLGAVSVEKKSRFSKQ